MAGVVVGGPSALQDSDLVTLDKVIKLCVTQGDISSRRAEAYARWLYFLFIYL